MKKKFSILGSTGSIGTQTLEVLDTLPESRILALTAHSNTDLLYEQIIKYKPLIAAVFDEEKADALKKKNPPCDVLAGMNGLIEAAGISGADMVINALVGGIGLLPTLAALNAGITVGLANKESLVTGGALVTEAAKKRKALIIPIDSEHSAISQCLTGRDMNSVRRIILTASGGPFLGFTKDELKNVTVDMALKHPNWSMGKKITIDSATLMNKGFEVIEAHWLFDIPAEQIDVIIHKESIIHSMVEFCDGSIIAQMGAPDMRLPISYAISYPEPPAQCFTRLDLLKCGSLTFQDPDTTAFPCLALAYKALAAGGTMSAVMNYANETAVRHFLNNDIPFSQIPDIIKANMDAHSVKHSYNADDISAVAKNMNNLNT